MKTRTTLFSLCTAGLIIVASSAFRGGCAPDPCPDLYVTCPEIECEQGFQVDKSGCAICECVGEVDPQPSGCQSDADCDEGQRCLIDDIVVMSPTDGGPANVDGGTDAADGGPSEELRGVCVGGEPSSCESLDEWSCIEAARCEPVYGDVCPAMCAEESPDCFCEPEFVGCVDAEPNTCWGAWVDETGTCRGPADGVLPESCCLDPEPVCSSDADCAEGTSCVSAVCVP